MNIVISFVTHSFNLYYVNHTVMYTTCYQYQSLLLLLLYGISIKSYGTHIALLYMYVNSFFYMNSVFSLPSYKLIGLHSPQGW